MWYVGPRSVIDNLGFVCTHQKSRDKGGEIQQQTKGKSRTNDPGDPPSFCRTATAPHSAGFLSQWGAASSTRLHLHCAHKAQHSTSRARGEPAPGEEQSWHPQPWQQQAKRHTWKPGLTARGRCNLCWVVLRARGPKSDLQVRVPSLPLGSCVTWSELLNLSVPRFYHLSKGRKIVSISWGGCSVKRVKIKH